MDLKSVKIMLNINNIKTLMQIICVLTVIYFGEVYALNCSGTEYNHRFRKYGPDSNDCLDILGSISPSNCKSLVDGVSVFAAIPSIFSSCVKYTCQVTLVPNSWADTYMLLCPAGCNTTSPVTEFPNSMVSVSEIPTSTSTSTENECVHECVMSTVNGFSCTMSYHHQTSTCSLYMDCVNNNCTLTETGNDDYKTLQSKCEFTVVAVNTQNENQDEGETQSETCAGVLHRFHGYAPDNDTCKAIENNTPFDDCINSADGVSVFAAISNSSSPSMECFKYSCPVTLVPDDMFDTYIHTCSPECSTSSPMTEFPYYNVSDSETPTSNLISTENACMHECVMSTVNRTSCTMRYHRPTSTCTLYTNCTGGLCNMTLTNSTDYRTTRSLCEDQECDCSLLNVPTGVEAPQCSIVLPGEMPEYNCSEHYLESSPSTTICQVYGNWIENPPTCYQAPCDDPPVPEYGTVSADGETANYTCDADYKRNGPPSRSCKWTPAKGPVWNGNDPTCDPIECPSEIDVLNGGAVVNLTSVDSEAYYYCDDGFIMNGANITVCLIYGNWSESAPFCQPTMCPTLPNPANGIVSVAGGTAPGNVAEYSCRSGYILSNSTPVVCTSNFTWSPEPPVCVREAPPLLYIRSCLCSTSNEFANKTQDEIIAHLIAETAINTQNTSLARSKLESSNDPRTSSRIIGTVAIIFMSIIGAFMVLVDCLSVCQKLERWNKVQAVDTDES